MKPDLRSTSQGKEPRAAQAQPATPDAGVNQEPPPAHAVTPEPETASPALSAEELALADLASKQQAIEDELAARRHAIDEERSKVRLSLLTRLYAAMEESQTKLLGQGVSRAEIAKRLGWPPAPTKKAKANGSGNGANRGGPATYEGWLATYLRAATNAYAQSHGIPRDKIPPDELAKIQEEAQAKAAAKCPPAAQPSEVTK